MGASGGVFSPSCDASHVHPHPLQQLRTATGSGQLAKASSRDRTGEVRRRRYQARWRLQRRLLDVNRTPVMARVLAGVFLLRFSCVIGYCSRLHVASNRLRTNWETAESKGAGPGIGLLLILLLVALLGDGSRGLQFRRQQAPDLLRQVRQPSKREARKP
jgi:hypothetical protein